MKPAPFAYHRPATLDGAVGLLAELAPHEGRVLAGGQSLAPMMAYWLPGLGATDTRVWDIEGHHFSERCGLFIIIALG